MIKNIVFDMGNVLISYDARRYVEKYAEGEEDRELLLQEVFASVEWVRQDRGNITEDEAIASICTRLPARLHGAVRDLFENWHRDIPPYPEMEELAARLKRNGYGIYLLSNTGRRYHEFRENIPALKYFDGEFVSCDWHLLKPSEEIFRAFCAHFGLPPASCFFIDDFALNVESAMNMGMQGFIFRQDVKKLMEALVNAGVTV